MKLYTLTPLNDEDQAHFEAWKNQLEKARAEKFEKTNRIPVNIYHVKDNKDIEVMVHRDTFKCLGDGLNLLKEKLPDASKLTDVRPLINNGVLVLKESRTLVRQSAKKEEKEQVTKLKYWSKEWNVWSLFSTNVSASLCVWLVAIYYEQNNGQIYLIYLAYETESCEFFIIQDIYFQTEGEITADVKNEIKSEIKTEPETIEVNMDTSAEIHVYKHIFKEIEARVNADTKELVGDPAEELAPFLEDGQKIAEHIEAGIFEFSRVEENIQVDIRITKVKFDIYLHEQSGLEFSVNSMTRKLPGRLSDKMKEVMGEKKLTDMIDDGDLKFVRSEERERKRKVKVIQEETKGLKRKIETTSSQNNHDAIEEKVFSVYLCKAKETSVTVYPKTMKILGRKPKWMGEKSVEEMIASGDFVQCGESIRKMNGNKKIKVEKKSSDEKANEKSGDISKECVLKSYRIKEGPGILDVAQEDSKVVLRFPSSEIESETFLKNNLQDLSQQNIITETAAEVKVENSQFLKKLLQVNLNYKDAEDLNDTKAKWTLRSGIGEILADAVDASKLEINISDDISAITVKGYTENIAYLIKLEETLNDAEQHFPEPSAVKVKQENNQKSEEMQIEQKDEKPQIFIEEGEEKYLMLDDDDDEIDNYYDENEYLSEDDSDITGSSESSDDFSSDDPDFTASGVQKHRKRSSRRWRKKKDKGKRRARAFAEDGKKRSRDSFKKMSEQVRFYFKYNTIVDCKQGNEYELSIFWVALSLYAYKVSPNMQLYKVSPNMQFFRMIGGPCMLTMACYPNYTTCTYEYHFVRYYNTSLTKIMTIHFSLPGSKIFACFYDTLIMHI